MWFDAPMFFYFELFQSLIIVADIHNQIQIASDKDIGKTSSGSQFPYNSYLYENSLFWIQFECVNGGFPSLENRTT